MCVFVTVKNVVHDCDKDLAQARSLSLMSLESKFIQQLCRIKRVSWGCRTVHASQAFQTTMLFPMVCDPQPLDMIMQKPKKNKEMKNNNNVQEGKKKKLPWHTVWISSCMIQLEKETLSIEIALSCASCTWCCSLLIAATTPQLKQPERIWLCSIA